MIDIIFVYVLLDKISMWRDLMGEIYNFIKFLKGVRVYIFVSSFDYYSIEGFLGKILTLFVECLFFCFCRFVCLGDVFDLGFYFL